ncbi:site-specific integrase [Candidatus Uhrbacteria bacterium]|nr:site-specific integrase [Candidatus Uhrbacteria bacterium]
MAWLTEVKRVNRASGKTEPYFAIQWRDPGTGKTRTRGLGFIPRTAAKDALTVFEGKLVTGKSVEPPRTERGSSTRAEPAGYTLARYLDEVYLPVVRRDKAPKTATSAQTSANALKPVLGDTVLSALDYVAIDGYVTARRALGRKSKTIIIELAWLRGALVHAVDSGVLSHLPKMPRIKNNDRRAHRFFSTEECERLLDAVGPLREQPHVVTRGKPPIPRDPLTYLAVLMALNLGMRKGEILSRGWEDVLWDVGPHGTMLVRAKPEIRFQVKTRHDRAIPMTPELADELRRRHVALGAPTHGWVFPSPTAPTRPRQDFGIALRRACKRAGLPPMHPHGLRHTWATRLAIAGVDRRTLMELGGWTEGRMLDEIYAHTTDAHKAEVMAKAGISRSANHRSPR